METIRVVLADDHPVVRSGIRNLLEKAPDILVVGEAGDSAETLRLAEELAPDVLLLDMEMPGQTGVETARQLRAAGSPVRILVLSAYSHEQYIFGLLESGAVGYLTKDEAMNTIVEAVRGVARGDEGWLSRRVMAKVLRQRDQGQGDKLQQEDECPLTDREQDVLQLLAKGWDNQQIAEALTISERTVKFHTGNIYQKFQVTSRAAAIVYALERGWVKIAQNES